MTAAGDGSRSYASLSSRYLPMAAQSPASEPQLASPSPGHGSFQFFADVGGEVCFAEDVFFDGKLVPFGLPPLPSARAPVMSVVPADHRRSASLDTARQRPHGLSAESGELRRVSSAPKAPLPTTGSTTRPVRWHMLALGGVTVPAKMEMRDIRSRQRRRRTPTQAAAAEAAKGSGERRSEGKDVSWRILRSLSCNAEGSSALSVAPPACSRRTCGAAQSEPSLNFCGPA